MGKNGEVITKQVRIKGELVTKKVYYRKLKPGGLSKAKLAKLMRPRIPRPNDPHWTNPGPHKGNCNCTICHHVINCKPGLHDDEGGKSCRQAGLALDRHDDECQFGIEGPTCAGLGLFDHEHVSGIAMASTVKIDESNRQEVHQRTRGGTP